MQTRFIVAALASALLFASVGNASADPRKSRIIFTSNGAYDPTNPGDEPKCLAWTVPDRLTVKHNDTITWKIENDTRDGNPCSFYNRELVSLDFDGNPPVDNMQHNGNIITAHVTATDGTYKYSVLFEQKVAQDPELDISGSKNGPNKAKKK